MNISIFDTLKKLFNIKEKQSMIGIRTLEVLVDVIPDAMYFKDKQNNWLLCNQAAINLFELKDNGWNGLSTPEIAKTSIVLNSMLDTKSLINKDLPLKGSCPAKLSKLAIDIKGKINYFIAREVAIDDASTNTYGTLITIYDVTESEMALLSLKASEKELLESKNLISTISANKNSVREEYRKRLAREIHDELGHVMASLSFSVGSIEAKDAASEERLQASKELIVRASNSVRKVITNLRPPILDLGIVPTIEWQCSQFSKTFDIDCKLNVLGDIPSMPEEININMFRIVQEAFTNIYKHAKASLVNVSVSSSGNFFNLMVRDNGLGFDYQPRIMVNNFGLLGINERAKSLGGYAHISSRENEGCKIVVSIPIQKI